ncbi:MAG: aldo/keto reductase [Bacteroidales bacterium]|nr:aldo/keto reductase [Bacteroidales bacterium]
MIPPVIFGTSALGNLFTALSDEVKLEIVSECFRHMPGTVVFDSAGKYGAGLALEMLGTCLKKLNIEPENVIISNKLGWYRTELLTPEPTFEPGVWRNLKHDARLNISYSGIMECFEQGNNLLGNVYSPQMLSVHDPDEYIHMGSTESERKKLANDIIEAYKALAELKKQGKAQAIGMGAKDWKIIRQLAPYIELDWVMFANSMTIMQQPQELITFMHELKQRGVAIINSAVFHSGFLTGSDYFDYKLIDPDNKVDQQRLSWRKQFFALCEKHAVSPATACINYAMKAPGVVAISLNTSKPGHVKANVESVNARVDPAFYKDMVKAGLLNADLNY